jgi:hypothetical protein
MFGLVVGLAIVLAQGLVEVTKALLRRNGKRNGKPVSGLSPQQDRQLDRLFESHEGNAAIRPDGTRRWWFPDKLLTTQDKILGELRSMNGYLQELLPKDRRK